MSVTAQYAIGPAPRPGAPAVGIEPDLEVPVRYVRNPMHFAVRAIILAEAIALGRVDWDVILMPRLTNLRLAERVWRAPARGARLADLGALLVEADGWSCRRSCLRAPRPTRAAGRRR